MTKSSSVHVRKVSPYPFDVLIQKAEAAPAEKAQILKIAPIGLITKVSLPTFKVGEDWLLRFELPVLKVPFRVPVKVIKTYDAAEKIQGKTTLKAYTVEFHFIQLEEQKLSAIAQFCRAIGQVIE
jgi:hypothetical protein